MEFVKDRVRNLVRTNGVYLKPCQPNQPNQRTDFCMQRAGFSDELTLTLTLGSILLHRKASQHSESSTTSEVLASFPRISTQNAYTSALGFLHSRTYLSPFTKDIRGEDQIDESHQDFSIAPPRWGSSYYQLKTKNKLNWTGHLIHITGLVDGGHDHRRQTAFTRELNSELTNRLVREWSLSRTEFETWSGQMVFT